MGSFLEQNASKNAPATQISDGIIYLVVGILLFRRESDFDHVA
jgi:hypothetical protein